MPQSDPGRPSASIGFKATLLYAAALTVMSAATIAPALPALRQHFAGSPHAELLVRLLLTMPAAFVALCGPLAGLWVDRFGRAGVLACSAMLYGIAGASGLVVDSLPALLLGRAGLGIAVAGTMTAATALVGDHFMGEARDRFMGQQIAFTGLGGMLCLSSGGWLAELSWHMPFALYMLAWPLVPLVWRHVPRGNASRAVSNTWIQRQPHAGRDSVPRAAARRAATSPRGLLVLLVVAILDNAAFYLIPTQLPFYLPAMGVRSAGEAGVSLGFFTAASAAASFSYGLLRRHGSVAGIFGLALLMQALGFGLLSVAHTRLGVVAALGATGAGIGLATPNLIAAALQLALPATRGRVTGWVTASIFTGQFLSPLVSQPLIAHYGFRWVSLGTAFAVLAGSVLACFVAARGRARRAAGNPSSLDVA